MASFTELLRYPQCCLSMIPQEAQKIVPGLKFACVGSITSAVSSSGFRVQTGSPLLGRQQQK
jgi:hypothetical protein